MVRFSCDGQEKGLFSGRGVLFMSVGQEKGPNSGRQLRDERPVRKHCRNLIISAVNQHVIARLDRAVAIL